VNRNFDELLIRTLVTVIWNIDPPWERNQTGRPAWNPRTIALCCFLKIFLNRTYDGIEAYLKVNHLVRKLIHADDLPGHSVIARGMEKLPMSYIRKVNRRFVLRLRRRGMDVAVDSSGFRLRSSSSWFDIRIRRKSKRRDHIKVHIVIDVETGIIHHFTITGWKGSDSKEFKRLLRYLPRIAKAAGDKAYSSRKNCDIVTEKGGKPYLCFKSNATGRAKGSTAWKVSFQSYSDDEEAWMKEYHVRSIVESVFASIKKCWGSAISSIKGWLKRRELALKVLAYNVKRVLFFNKAEESGIPLWDGRALQS